MELHDAIEKRFSVRKYHDKAVEDDKLRRVLEAGRIAPSARNLQDWKFIAIRDAATREALADAADQPWLAAAPVIIAVVGLDSRTMFCDVPAAPVDCAIAIDHMTLAAVAEGLGSCWIGHFKQNLCCEILSVPPGAKIIEMLALGYPNCSQPEKKRKPFDEVVCFEKFA